MREVGEYIGSPVQSKENSEGAPDGHLRDQNEGGKGQSKIPDGWAHGWGSGRSELTIPNQPRVSMSQIVTGDLGHHGHFKFGVVLLSCPHGLAWVWATYNLSLLSFPALGSHTNSPVFLAVNQKDFGTQIALSLWPGDLRLLVLFPTWLRGLSRGLVLHAASVSFHSLGSYLLGRRPLHISSSTL